MPPGAPDSSAQVRDRLNALASYFSRQGFPLGDPAMRSLVCATA